MKATAQSSQAATIEPVDQSGMNRGKWAACCTLVLMTLYTCIVGCTLAKTEQPPLNRYEGSFIDVFDTVTKVVIYDTDKEAAMSRVNAIHEELAEYHRLFDIYHDYVGVNNIKSVNDNAGKSPVAVDARIIELIRFSKKAYAATNGKVNIAMGSVLGIWHNYREEGIDMPERAALPPMEQLRAAAEHTDIDRVIVDEQAGTIYVSDPNMRLDVGAIAKGFAVQQVANHQREAGVTSLLLSVGGNVCAVGGRIDGSDWQVGVQSPNMQGTLCKIALHDMSLVTSGAYQRYYTVDGVRYHHIIDPETLAPARYYDAVSILCADSALADALSTAVFNMPLAEGMALIEGMAGVEALWVMQDGAVKESGGFQQWIVAAQIGTE